MSTEETYIDLQTTWPVTDPEAITLPEGATSLHFMQAIYRDPRNR
jgi:hypothetical protein